jgi:hypothetical protein
MMRAVLMQKMSDLPASAGSRQASSAFRFLLSKNRFLSVLALFWIAQAMCPAAQQAYHTCRVSTHTQGMVGPVQPLSACKQYQQHVPNHCLNLQHSCYQQ